MAQAGQRYRKGWTGTQSQTIPLGIRSYVDEVLIGATDNVVIRHSNRVYTATRRLQDMDAVEGSNVPDLRAITGHLVPGQVPHYHTLWGSRHSGKPTPHPGCV